MDEGKAAGAGTARPGWFDRRARPEHARACYRYILGREPEGDAVLERHVAAAGTIGALRTAFLASTEFRRSLRPSAGEEERAPPPALADEPGPVPEVETTAPAEALARMMLWQQRVWARLGQEVPHWSVLPEDRFRPEWLAGNGRAFAASGAADAALLLAALRRNGIAPDAVPRLLEHGCGIGRVTPWLAQHFPEITGVDVSAPHLALARAAARQRGLVHLRWLRARAEDPMPGGGFDLWFSRRVLQWNPPPLTCDVLRRAFAALGPGGVAVFSLPTWRSGYRFATGAYVAGPQPAAPVLHMVPQAVVFALAAEGRMQVLEVREDTHLPGPEPGSWRSHLFVLRKAG